MQQRPPPEGRGSRRAACRRRRGTPRRPLCRRARGPRRQVDSAPSARGRGLPAPRLEPSNPCPSRPTTVRFRLRGVSTANAEPGCEAQPVTSPSSIRTVPSAPSPARRACRFGSADTRSGDRAARGLRGHTSRDYHRSGISPCPEGRGEPITGRSVAIGVVQVREAGARAGWRGRGCGPCGQGAPGGPGRHHGADGAGRPRSPSGRVAADRGRATRATAAASAHGLAQARPNVCTTSVSSMRWDRRRGRCYGRLVPRGTSTRERAPATATTTSLDRFLSREGPRA